MSNVTVLYVGNDNILEVANLKNDVSGADINNATVSVILADDNGAQIGGATWPMALSYVTGSKGVYRATLPYTLEMTAGLRMMATVTVDAGPLRAQFDLECVARSRS